MIPADLRCAAVPHTTAMRAEAHAALQPISGMAGPATGKTILSIGMMVKGGTIVPAG